LFNARSTAPVDMVRIDFSNDLWPYKAEDQELTLGDFYQASHGHA